METGCSLDIGSSVETGCSLDTGSSVETGCSLDTGSSVETSLEDVSDTVSSISVSFISVSFISVSSINMSDVSKPVSSSTEISCVSSVSLSGAGCSVEPFSSSSSSSSAKTVFSESAVSCTSPAGSDALAGNSILDDSVIAAISTHNVFLNSLPILSFLSQSYPNTRRQNFLTDSTKLRKKAAQITT